MNNLNNNNIENILFNNKCKLINIVWIDRCIKLAIIFNILLYYEQLLNKIIIIDNCEYRYFIRHMFPELKFIKFNKNNNIYNKKYFYINIKNILINKDIIIDYISNYPINIPTDKIYCIPWFDVNDPIITFIYNKNNNLEYLVEYNTIFNFSHCIRSNKWDIKIEYMILNYYRYIKSINNIQLVYNKFNYYIKKNYNNYNMNNKIYYYPIIYYKENTSHLKETEDTSHELSKTTDIVHEVESTPDKMIEFLSSMLDQLDSNLDFKIKQIEKNN
jgi:hypothetical protein